MARRRTSYIRVLQGAANESKNEGGYINHVEDVDVTGGTVKVIRDVDTTQTGTFSNLPSG